MCAQSQEWIDDALKCLHPRNGHGKILAMIQGYLDESGIHDQSAICLIAGYFGGPGQWRKVGNEWTGILNRYDVPEFHAKQFWGFDEKAQRVGPYRGWSDKKADRFLEELLEIIGRHKIHPVSCALVVSSFNKLSYNQRRFLTGGKLERGKFINSGCPSKPYFVPFQTCILDVADHAPLGGKAHFFFDLNKQFKGYALDLFALLKSLDDLKVQDRIGQIDFPTSLDAVQLQTADLLCYRTYEYAHKRASNPNEKLDPILRSLLKRLPIETNHFLNDEGFSTLLHGVNLPSD